MTPDPLKYVTPPTYARRIRVAREQVVLWIKSGELAALDSSDKPGISRPRWKISPAAIIEFESRRSASPPPKKRCRQKRDPSVRSIIK